MEGIKLRDIAPLGGAGPVRQEEEDETVRKERHALISGCALQEYKQYKKMLANPEWHAVPYKGAEGISCFELPVTYLDPDNKKDPVYTIKASGYVIGKTADDIAKAHMDSNHISRLGWDKELSDIGLLEIVRVDENLGIQLTVQYAEHTPSVPGVDKREFVYFQWSRRVATKKHKTDHNWEIIARHVDHPKRPVKSSPVRALSLSVIVLEPLTPDESELLLVPRTNVTIMAWVQPGGWIPDNIVSLYKTKLADRIKFLRETTFFS